MLGHFDALSAPLRGTAPTPVKGRAGAQLGSHPTLRPARHPEIGATHGAAAGAAGNNKEFPRPVAAFPLESLSDLVFSAYGKYGSVPAVVAGGRLAIDAQYS